MVEVILPLVGMYVGCVMVFIGKALADISSNETHWRQSILSKNPIDSFWGSKEYTYIRKDNSNKFINWLLHYPLVFITDIWHFANTIRRFGIYLSVFSGILFGNFTLITIFNLPLIMFGYIILNALGFHLFYHFILRNRRN